MVAPVAVNTAWRPKASYTPAPTRAARPATARPVAPSRPWPLATWSGGLAMATATWLLGRVKASAVAWMAEMPMISHSGPKP